MKRRIRILLVDDHTLIREGVASILACEEDMGPIDHAAGAAEALAAIRASVPDIVLLDRRMPDSDGFDLLPEIRKLSPHSRVIMMTASATRGDVLQAKEFGASGHLLKTVRGAALITSIRTVLAGGTCFDARADAKPLLSPREVELLEHIHLGQSNHDISLSLNISENTVKWHLKVIFAKLGVASRAEAVTRGFELGILGA